MEFPSEVLQALTYLGNNSYISEENFKRIINSCVGLLAEEQDIERISSICPEKAEIVQLTYSSVLSFLIESIRSESGDDIIRTFLEGRKLKSDRIEYIIKVFNTSRNIIRKSLENCHSGFPNIVDINWRLDYVIKSSTQNSIGEPLYYIVLTTESEGKLDYVKFTCNLHQLQDLSTKFREIVSHIEKLSSVN